jgi:hypothetical protein
MQWPALQKSGGCEQLIQTQARDRFRLTEEKTPFQEDHRMWLYVQTWLPLLTISLTAAICFGVAGFIMADPKSQQR